MGHNTTYMEKNQTKKTYGSAIFDEESIYKIKKTLRDFLTDAHMSGRSYKSKFVGYSDANR